MACILQKNSKNAICQPRRRSLGQEVFGSLETNVRIIPDAIDVLEV